MLKPFFWGVLLVSTSSSIKVLTVDLEAYLLRGAAELVGGDADVHAGVVAVQGHDLQRAVRQQPVAARVALDLHSKWQYNNVGGYFTILYA